MQNTDKAQPNKVPRGRFSPCVLVPHLSAGVEGLLHRCQRTLTVIFATPAMGREYAFAEVESGHSAAFLANGRCAIESAAVWLT